MGNNMERETLKVMNWKLRKLAFDYPKDERIKSMISESHAVLCGIGRVPSNAQQGWEVFAWLIEAPGTNYLGARKVGHYHDFFWTREHGKAIRFFDKQQCDLTMMAIRRLQPELFAFGQLGEAWPREHKWLAPTPIDAVTEEEAVEIMAQASWDCHVKALANLPPNWQSAQAVVDSGKGEVMQYEIAMNGTRDMQRAAYRALIAAQKGK